MIIERQDIGCNWKVSGEGGEGKNGKWQQCKCIVKDFWCPRMS